MDIDALRQRNWLVLPGTLCTEAALAGVLDALGIAPMRRQALRLSRPTIDDYADALVSQGADAVICGFSLGAIVAAHHADRVAAAQFVLFGLNPYPDDPAKAAGRRDLEDDVQSKGGAAALARRLPPLAGPRPDVTRATILAMAEEAAPDIGAHTALALSRPGALAALSRSRAPVLCLTGSHDAMAPPAQGNAAAKAAPIGQFRTLPGLGHYAPLEDAALCARAIESAFDIHD